MYGRYTFKQTSKLLSREGLLKAITYQTISTDPKLLIGFWRRLSLQNFQTIFDDSINFRVEDYYTTFCSPRYPTCYNEIFLHPGAILGSHWSWWRHQMETFSALLVICAENSLVPGEFHAQRPVTRSFGVFFDLHPNKRLSKQSRDWWFETPSRPLWRHFNYYNLILIVHKIKKWILCEASQKFK